MERTPWHIWVVGILATLWNAGGAWNYTALKLQISSVLDQMTEPQIDFFMSMPAWATATWALAVWGAVIGSILILMRRAMAFPVLVISFVSMLITTVHNFLLADVPMTDIMPPGAALFSVAIFVVSLLLIWYAKVQRDAGRLR